MAVFRIEKTRDYTVMSNHHLRNTNLSLKAKGLLSLMLSLPENTTYVRNTKEYLLNHGNLKGTQSDTGHAGIDMITSTYVHILDGDRKIDAQKFESAFYSSPDLHSAGPQKNRTGNTGLGQTCGAASKITGVSKYAGRFDLPTGQTSQ